MIKLFGILFALCSEFLFYPFDNLPMPGSGGVNATLGGLSERVHFVDEIYFLPRIKNDCGEVCNILIAENIFVARMNIECRNSTVRPFQLYRIKEFFVRYQSLFGSRSSRSNGLEMDAPLDVISARNWLHAVSSDNFRGARLSGISYRYFQICGSSDKIVRLEQNHALNFEVGAHLLLPNVSSDINSITSRSGRILRLFEHFAGYKDGPGNKANRRYRARSHYPLSDGVAEPPKSLGAVYFGLWIIFVGFAGVYVASRRLDSARWVFSSMAGTLFVMIGSMILLAALGCG